MVLFRVYFSKFLLTEETARHDRRRRPYCFHCQTTLASPRKIDFEVSCTCIVVHRNICFAESSRAATLWRHDREGHHQHTVSLSIFQGRVAMFWEENLTKRNINVTILSPIESGMSRFSRKVRLGVISDSLLHEDCKLSQQMSHG